MRDYKTCYICDSCNVFRIRQFSLKKDLIQKRTTLFKESTFLLSSSVLLIDDGAVNAYNNYNVFFNKLFLKISEFSKDEKLFS